MGYIDAQRIVEIAEDFVGSIESQRKSSLASGYFRSKVSDIGRDFEKGTVKREELAGKIADILKQFRIYLESSEVRALEKTIKML